MSRAPSRRAGVRGPRACLLLTLCAAPAAAQPPPPAPALDGPTLDPDSPMAELPDLGIAWPDPAAGGAATAAPAPPVSQRYAVRLEGLDGVEGLDDAAFRARFDAASLLVQNDGKPANVAQLDRRAREDADTLLVLLRAEGYYDAAVDTRVAAADAGRVTAVLAVRPGPRYRFDTVSVAGLEAAAPAVAASFAVKPGDPVDADAVLAAQDALKAALGRAGYSYAAIPDPSITVDHETRTATLALAVTPGAVQRFGAFRIEGRRLFGVEHLGVIARFAPGDPLDAALVDDFRRALIQTGLVSSVTLRPVATIDPAVSDMVVRLERAPPRTVAGEIGYGTGEGARLALSWTHRNLFPPEGAFTVSGVAGTQEQALGVTLRRGNFRRRDQVLNAQVTASDINRAAFDARTFTMAANIERQTNIIWQKTWTWTFGAELVASDERDVALATGQSRRRTFFIAALPTGLAYDGTDDLLNPQRGYRLSGRISPEASLQGGAFGYARAQLDGSAYLPWSERVVFAGRGRLGSIFGAGRGRIAPSRRFYAGGGGSVRGYGFQDVGPRDADNDPIGGRSLFEAAVEARVRFGDIGVVPFLDAGNLYTTTLPRFTGLRYGAGIGARYYSSFGPIRVDVGTPINPRRGDARLAVYVSLGQAF